MVYLIGVEGGATSCRIRIEDEKGEVIGEQNIDKGINISAVPEAKAWEIIFQGISETLRAKEIDIKDKQHKFYACFGLAGSGRSEVRDRFLAYGREHYHYFQKLDIKTDAKITCYGAHGGGKGAIIIVGTGAIAFASVLPAEDKEIRVGGYGFPHADKGGWAWLGLRAIGLLFEALDDPQLASELTRVIYKDHFHNNLTELIAWANSIPKPGAEDYAAIGKYVVSYASSDPNAQRLLKEAAAEIDRLFGALEAKAVKEGVTDKLSYYLWGGVADSIRPYLSAELRMRLIEHPKMSPVEGAVVIARQNLASEPKLTDVALATLTVS